MGYSTDVDIFEIEEQVRLLEKACDLYSQMYSFVTQTEVGGMMHNILLGIRRLESSVSQLIIRQNKTLLDVVPFKIDKIRKKLGYISSDLKLSQTFDVDKKDEEDTTDWDKMIVLENEGAPFTIGDNYEAYKNTRLFLMSNTRRYYYEAEERINNIIRKLGELETLKKHIDKNEDTQRKIYMEMMTDYRDTEWRQDRDSYILQVNSSIKKDKEKGIAIIETLKKELRGLEMTHLNSFMSKPVRSLYNTVINFKRYPFEAIVRHKKVLKEDDITTYFSFLFKHSTLKEHIDSIPLGEPLTGQYKKLFTSKAAKEYIDILAPVLTMYGGLDGKEHYGVLLLVMMDLGLAQTDSKPYLPMMNYANERLDGAFEEQSMISKTAKPLLEACFCELEYEDVGETTLTVEKIREYQDVYWRCFTILNQRGLRMPNEKKVASYLKNPHKNINLSVIMEGFRAELLIRLDFLRSVIRKETLVFG